MSLKALSEYTFVSRYARYNTKKKRRETWEESVARVYDMHREKYADAIINNPELGQLIDFAQSMQNKKRMLGAQRTLQFAGAPIFKHELKVYNCLFTHIDRPRVFQETMFALLCGTGVGFSVQKQHISKLPTITNASVRNDKIFVIEDSIEGWADAIGVIINSWLSKPIEFLEYKNCNVVFDASLIRPAGSLIAGQFKAPGSVGLMKALGDINEIIRKRVTSDAFTRDEFKQKLRPIDCYDIIMHISNAVLSGGVRRAATLCMFSYDDMDMLTAKTGNWMANNAHRARSNNSVALLRGCVTPELFHEIMKSTKEFGEPGFIWLDDLDFGFNPCCEISMYPKTEDGRSGFQGCNLTEINGKWCTSEENFMKACEASAIIGTLQAGYTNFNYLDSATKEIFERESLLGCSITGWMDNPDILLNKEIQQKGAAYIIAVNKKVAAMIGINPAARVTCAKPSGSTSCILGTASGIHPHHAKRYIRRVQANKTEFCLQETERINPTAVEDSVWSTNKTDKIISFLCEVPPGAIVKNQIGAVELLEKVKLTQQNWVEYGTVIDRCVKPGLRHNVSNTITVKPDEWDDVEKYIFDNQNYFAGISLLPSSGDLDYAQAPFATVLTASELVKEYGDASVFASGLIVDGLHAFDKNLWAACDTVLGIGEELGLYFPKPEYPTKKTNKDIANYFLAREDHDVWFAKTDWVRRVKQFADRYFDSDVRRATYCLKHVSLWKTWCDLKRDYVEVDWELAIEESETYIAADTMGAQACNGGSCELI